MYNNKKHTKNTKNFKKKENPSGGLPHLPTSEFFMHFWLFLTWQNPLIQ